MTSVEELAQFCARLLEGDSAFGFDIETGYHGEDKEKFSLHPETAIIAGISFTNSTDWARYAPLGHDSGENLDNHAAARLLWPVLSSGRGVAHNAPFELRHLSRWFRELLGDDPRFGAQIRAANGYFKIKSDSQVEAYIMAEHEKFGLKPLVETMFGHKMTELFELFPGLPKNKRKCLRFNILDQHDPKVVEYACEDALWCLAVHHRFYDQVKDHLLYRVEHAIVQDSVPEMEDVGIRYDWELMRRTADELRSFRSRFNAEIMAELSEMTATPTAVNLASPPQVSKVLYEQLGLRTTVWTDGTRDLPPGERKMSTGKIALVGLAKKHPVVRKIVEWKEQTRLLGTYLEKYEGLYNYADDGRAHPNHMSAVVITGRFAVSDPPYQGSPKLYHYDLAVARDLHARHADEHGDKCTCNDPQYTPPPGTCFIFNFRDVITVPDGYYMLGFDLSQAELRAIAGQAQEPELLKAFEEGRDVHTITASLMLGVPIEQVTKQHRDIGKTLNFALLYGMSAKGLADRLGIPAEEAEELMAAYFDSFPRIKAWIEKQIDHGRTHGYVTSKFGRRLPIWEYRSDKRWIRQKGDRACVNYPIQGSATGDYIKIAMVRARAALHKAGLQNKVHLVMNVHDALEFYVDISLLPQDVISVLQPAVIFPVPGWPAMRADWHFGKRWGSLVNITLTDDGRFLVQTDVEYELKPSIDVDEETEEEFEVLPEVDPETLREVLHRSKPTPAASRHIIVELDDMPSEDGYRRFLDLLQSTPGPHHLTLRTPEGDLDIDLPHGTSLGTEHLAQVYLLLGNARLRFDATSVDPDTLLDGVAL